MFSASETSAVMWLTYIPTQKCLESVQGPGWSQQWPRWWC